MVHIEDTHFFPVSVSEAFAYITGMAHWPEYWPDFVRIEDEANARWREPGDRITLVINLLNRERALNMKLAEFQADVLVTYTSQQNGLPDARHERHFKAVPGGVEYRIVVDFTPRGGFTALFDRLFVKRAVERTIRRTFENLDRQLAA